MGNNNNTEQKKFLTKYAFIEFIKDENFGPIKIYRKKQLNFDYVMIIDRYIDNNSIELAKRQITAFQNLFNNQEEPMILKILSSQIFEQNQCNIPCLRIYIEYYNYTVQEFKNKRQLNKDWLNFDQILYILNTTVQTYELFQKINPNIFQCSIKSIFITPQGQIKFSPLKVKDFAERQNNICGNVCNKSTKFQINFDHNHKHFISDLKKLFQDLNKPLKENSQCLMKDNQLLAKLQTQLNSARTLIQLKRVIPTSTVDCLNVRKRQNDQEDQNPTTELQFSNKNNSKKQKLLKMG